MNQDPLVQMRQDFIADASEKVDKISRSLAEFDPEQPTSRARVDLLFRTAHSLKGTAGMFDLEAVSKVAGSIENVLELIRSSNLVMDREVAGLLLDAFDEVSALFSRAGGENTDSRPGDIIERIERFLEAPAQTAKVDTSEPIQAEHASTDQACDSPPEAHLGVKVGIDILDSIMNTISELYSVRVGLAGIADRLPRTNETRRLRDDLLKLGLLINKRVTALEQTITEVRLVPISMLFERYRAEVRRLARRLGKSIGLAFEGESTLVDRALLERLHDPLLHIIRNAVSHGIETPSERTAAGKPVQGTVLVRARQESNHMRIDVEDDGRGIDTGKIKAAARTKGISLGPADSAIDMIFRPGFSTKEGLDDVSGRGVGLDAVRTRVDGMRGVTAVDSQPGTGTTFSIWVPLTLAVSRGILVEEGGIPVIVPLGRVVEIVSLRDGLRDEMIERNVLSCKGQEFRFLSLSKSLGLRAETKSSYAVITGVGAKSLAIGVGKVCGETEIVSRPLPAAVSAPHFISGAAELHDGRTAVIVQPEEMSRAMPAARRRPETGCGSPVSAKELIEGWQQGKLLNLLVFRSGPDLFASPLYLLREVVQIRGYTPLPSLGDSWEGLFFVRGMCHGLATLGRSSGIDNAAQKVVVYRVPERCGIAATDIVGSMVIPYRKLEIVADTSDSDPSTPVATFEWKGSTVAVVDIGGVLQEVLPVVERPAGNGGHQLSTEALMQASSPDDKQV